MLGDLGNDTADDFGVLEKQVVTAHPWFASQASSDHDNVRPLSVDVVVGSNDLSVAAH